MRTQESRSRRLSERRGRLCAAWVLDPEKDPVRLQVMKRDAVEVSMRASHHDRQYFLYLDLTGHGRHHCTCRDYAYGSFFSRPVPASDLFCRHIVAAALKEERLELLLSLLTKLQRRHHELK